MTVHTRYAVMQAKSKKTVGLVIQRVIVKLEVVDWLSVRDVVLTRLAQKGATDLLWIGWYSTVAVRSGDSNKDMIVESY